MSSRLRTIWLACAALGMILTMAGAIAQETGTAGTPGVGNYQVNPGDILDVSVWREVDLQRQAVVRPDGYFSFPLTGDIRAEGQTIEGIRQELTARISRFVPEPVVSVAVLEPRGSKVYVIGQVNRPGEFPANRIVDVVQAISMAGGTTPFAQLDNIKILRREGNTQLAIPFAYSDIAAGKRLQQNILLRPGDTVLVP
ncbi:MAG: polysaccharide biosynthesis/export family protein [Gammaproteobacteria bacterium]|nr:polysaccharide biosynthesis/export family protein [Gammaproteobacteria bacterium]